MKISKLFHWLYALVMLLPIFAIGVTCLVNTFNNEAKAESNITYEYETNVVTDSSSLVNGNIYKYTIESGYTENTNIIKTKNIFKYNVPSKEIDYTETNVGYGTKYIRLIYNNNRYELQLYSGGWQWLNYDNNNSNIQFPFSFYFTYNAELYDENFVLNVNNVSKSDYLPIKEVQQKDISNIFYYSVDKVTQSNIFNWAYDSFLVAPFTYIVTLFSMPSNSPVVMLLSYWLAISIIWLVFDLVMYVPLLVHRWLDKGVIE